MTSAVVEVEQISRRFGAVRALRDVSFAVHPGEVVALVGDNGAGKSTMVKILSGVMSPSSGNIKINGEPVTFDDPVDARRHGVETVYQDLALAPDVPIWANMFVGRELVRQDIGRWFGWLDRTKMATESTERLKRTKIRIGSVEQVTGKLSGGQRQAIAVGRAVSWGSNIVLMDEPTAALGVEQQEQVGALIRDVADTGTPVLLISHNLPQVHDVCDRVLVLFQGTIVADLSPKESSVEEIVYWITGAGTRGKGNE